MAESKAMLYVESQARLSLHDQGLLYPVEMTFAKRLKDARLAAGKTQAKVASAAGVSTQAVSGWERGEATPETDRVPLIARAVGRTSTWLLEGDEPDVRSEDVAAGLAEPPRQRMVKVKGYVGAGAEAHYYRLADEEYEEVPAPEGATDQTVALEIKGTSLGPLLETWLVFFKDIHSPVDASLVNKVCVVGLADDRVLVKKIVRNRRGGYDLVSNTSNDQPIENAKIEWAALVNNMTPRT